MMAVASGKARPSSALSADPDSHLPDCMMPDGGECCAGYATICEDWHKQRRRIEKLERALHDLYEFCAKQNEIRLGGGLGKFHHVSLSSLSRSARANAFACSSACPLVSISGRSRGLGTSSKWKNLDARPSAK